MPDNYVYTDYTRYSIWRQLYELSKNEGNHYAKENTVGVDVQVKESRVPQAEMVRWSDDRHRNSTWCLAMEDGILGWRWVKHLHNAAKSGCSTKKEHK